MTTIIMTKGLPASGKSLWAKEQVAQSDEQIVRVNMDNIREMIGLSYSPVAEKLALGIQDQAILSAVAAGKDIIVDNTHLDQTMPTRIRGLFDGEVTFKVQDFTDQSVRQCIDGDAWRARNGLRSVGPDVIRKMAGKLGPNKWTLTEEFMNDYMFPLIPLEVIEGAERVAVFDIDGTIALRTGRHPHDYSLVDRDVVAPHIARLARYYWNQDYRVIFVSGRPDTYKELDIRAMTELWLRQNHIFFDQLYMRNGITQKDWNDADVKHYIINTELRGKVNIEIWFDDRDRVVRRLRKLNIPVNQVAEGNF
jgi:predicted kinase